MGEIRETKPGKKPSKRPSIWYADSRTAERRLGKIRSVQEQINRLQAIQAREVAAHYADREGAADVCSEIALLLSIGERQAQRQVELSVDLVTRLPRILEEMEDGRLDTFKASKIADASAVLDDEQARRVDEIMAARVNGKIPQALRESTRRAVHQVDPEALGRQAEQARRDRAARLCHGDDGMASLQLDLPAEVASAAYARIDRMARPLRGQDGETRTLDELRADVAADLLLGTEHGHPGVKAEIFVYVDMNTLAGLNDDPAQLAGHGTIPAWLAREIAHQPGSTWRRIITDPATGAPVDVGRERYRPPAVTDDFVRIRDKECRHPGCRRPAQFGDVDHNTAWAAGGGTNHRELAGFCRRHHGLRHTPGWTYDLDPDTGILTITTPSDLVYTSEPEPLHPPRPGPPADPDPPGPPL